MAPHGEFGDSECCGLLVGIIGGDKADIGCNECDTILKTVPAGDPPRAFDDMVVTLDFATDLCPHCCGVNVLSGFSNMLAYTCRQHGKPIRVGR